MTATELTVSASEVSGSVSLANTLTKTEMSSAESAVSATAVGPSFLPVKVTLTLAQLNVPLPSLIAYLATGQRRVSAWQNSQNKVCVDFSDNQEAFNNLNTLEDLVALEHILNRA